MEIGDVVKTPELDHLTLAFEALKDLTEILPMQNPSFAALYEGIRRVLTSGIFVHKDSIPEHLIEYVESADIDEALVE